MTHRVKNVVEKNPSESSQFQTGLFLTDDLTSPGRVFHSLKDAGHPPIHSLGQNFLTDRPLLDAMVDDLELTSSHQVLEIGPGLGHLTRSLLATGAHILAIEIDRYLAQTLDSRLSSPDRLKILNQDILKITRDDLLLHFDQSGKITIAGNLPYYCSTPILLKLFEDWLSLWDQAAFLLQEEVVDRLITTPGSKSYGRLSVLVQSWSHPQKKRILPAHLFTPRPEVNSAWCLITPLQTPPNLCPHHLSRITALCFGERRKTLLNNLARSLGKDSAVNLLNRIGIDGKRRAETLSIQEFHNLATHIHPTDITC